MKDEKKFYDNLEKHLSTEGFEFENKGKTSKQFKMDTTNVVRTELSRLFDISIEEEYFNEVCNGTGSEIDKITSIWSSSLLSFLVFYSAIKNGGIDINIKDLGNVHFTEVYFEFLNPTFKENPRINSKQVSNMDCVLLSEDKEIILFIESKFKEYITDAGKADTLSDKYYNDEYTKNICMKYREIVNDGSDIEHYLDGIKQLVTHYSGLNNFKNNVFHNNYTNEKSNDRRKEIVEAKKNGADFYFMEIVNDFSQLGYENEFNDYKNISSKLEEEMNEDQEINVLPLTTYQELLDYENNKSNINQKIKYYYKF